MQRGSRTGELLLENREVIRTSGESASRLPGVAKCGVELTSKACKGVS
jgi:hypothetical protein